MNAFPPRAAHGLLALFASTYLTVAVAGTVNPLFGEWARDSRQCSEAELSFQPEHATIRIDADGEPVLFDYPTVKYVMNGNRVNVDLGRKHPYGKTVDKKNLHFINKSPDQIWLQLRKGKIQAFIRCS